MPLEVVESPFEHVVLTQGAIRCKQMLTQWMQKKQAAQKEPDEEARGKNLSALDPDRGASREEVARNLFTEFMADHTGIFRYASAYNKRREEMVFHVDDLSAAQKGAIKKIFDQFVDTCYDEQGKLQIQSTEQAARELHKLYHDLKTSHVRDAGNPDKIPVPLRYKRFPAGYIMAQLGQSEKWKPLTQGKGIDFNRGEKPDVSSDLLDRFQKAFDSPIDEVKKNKFSSSEYIHHHQSHVEIAGHRFPCLKFDWGQTHLLTDNGYCVDLTRELSDKLSNQLRNGASADACMIDFVPPVVNPTDAKTHHLSDLIQTDFKLDLPAGVQPTERQGQYVADACDSLIKLKNAIATLKTAPKIDGRNVVPGKAMLVSMDIDLLTGLSMVEQKQPDGSTKKSDVARLAKFVADHTSVIVRDVPGLRKRLPGDLVVMSDFLALFPSPKNAANYGAAMDTAFAKLRAIATEKGDSDIEKLIDIAKPHIKAVAPRIMSAVEKHFFHEKKDGKHTVSIPIDNVSKLREDAKKDEERKMHKQPRFFMTVGGVAAGKSNAEKIADEECGKDNYIIAGLDHVRSMFDRQAINIATDNHNFDYKNIEQAGKLVRALVLERARKQGYHVLLDGSGIPYESRYAPILKAFKEDEYKTSVLAFDRTLYVNNPGLRESLLKDGKAPQDALLQQGQRKGRELRAVPVKIIATNYASVPDALLEASVDPNVDRFWLIDTDPKKSKSKGASSDKTKGSSAVPEVKPYILSFTTEITGLQLDVIDKKKGQGLREALEGMQVDTKYQTRNKKIAKALGHANYSPGPTDPEQWDFKVIGKTDDNHYRIEIITDTTRYLSMLEKGLLNREAGGPEALFTLTKGMSWDVEGMFQNQAGTLNVQPERNINAEARPQIPYATKHSLAAKRENCFPNPHENVSLSSKVEYVGAGVGRF